MKTCSKQRNMRTLTDITIMEKVKSEISKFKVYIKIGIWKQVGKRGMSAALHIREERIFSTG